MWRSAALDIADDIARDCAKDIALNLAEGGLLSTYRSICGFSSIARSLNFACSAPSRSRTLVASG